MNAAAAYRDRVSMVDRYEDQEHDIRAAMFGIEASVQALRDQRHRLTALQTDELADGLMAEVRRLRRLLEGEHDEPTMFDLADAIAPVIASVCASGLDVHSTIPEGLGVYGRRDSAARVVLTLLDNARHHAGSSPVELRASVLGSSIVLYVEDRGGTITDRSPERMFQRGVRGCGSTGSGLGLFVARRLMAEQGGSIAFRARPGGGASFVVRFRARSSGTISQPRRAPRASHIPQ